VNPRTFKRIYVCNECDYPCKTDIITSNSGLLFPTQCPFGLGECKFVEIEMVLVENEK
jgi:hypothetical protein